MSAVLTFRAGPQPECGEPSSGERCEEAAAGLRTHLSWRDEQQLQEI